MCPSCLPSLSPKLARKRGPSLHFETPSFSLLSAPPNISPPACMPPAWTSRSSCRCSGHQSAWQYLNSDTKTSPGQQLRSHGMRTQAAPLTPFSVHTIDSQEKSHNRVARSNMESATQRSANRASDVRCALADCALARSSQRWWGGRHPEGKKEGL